MTDAGVNETIIYEQYTTNKIDEFVLDNIEPVSNTKRKTISTNTSK